MQIILASKSPRRKEILSKCNIEFICIPSDIDETINPNNDLKEEVINLSYRKAKSILNEYPDSLVIGSDTMVVIDNKVLGKPSDREDAFKMIKSLQGKTHQVLTGLCFISQNKVYKDVSVSNVTFKEMSDEEINNYLDLNEYQDKAGSYGIQGYAGRYITNIDGDFYAIMGLPLNKVYTQLKLIEEY